MTPIESLIDRVLPFIDRTKVSDVELQGIVEEHIAMEKEQISYSKEDVREMLFMALNEPKETCCTTHTQDSIVRKVLKTFKSE